MKTNARGKKSTIQVWINVLKDFSSPRNKSKNKIISLSSKKVANRFQITFEVVEILKILDTNMMTKGTAWNSTDVMGKNEIIETKKGHLNINLRDSRGKKATIQVWINASKDRDK